jgi:hypothetical protein
MKTLSPVDYVLQNSKKMYAGNMQRGWFCATPADAQKALLEIKKAYIAGNYAGISTSAVCVAVIELMKENSWPAPKSKCTIQRWLHSSDT